MRIWLFNHYAIPPTEAGGTRHYSLARALQARGHEVYLIASSYAHGSGTQRLTGSERWKLEVVEGVSFLWIAGSPYSGNSLPRIANMLQFARRAPLIARRELPAPDVVVGSSPHLWAAAAANRAAHDAGVPFVLEVRDIWPESLVDVAGVPRWHPLVLWLAHLERQVYRSASRIVALLPQFLVHAAKFGVLAQKVVHVPNGIDLSLNRQATAAPAGPPYTVMYAGAHGVANALQPIVEAAAKIQDEEPGRFRFVFIGQGPEKERLRKEALRQGAVIEFHDPVPKDQIPGELAKAHILVANVLDRSLYQNGVSLNKFFDYLSAARPIVVGVNAANNPIAEAKAGETVAPGDSEAIKTAIVRLANLSPEDRAVLGENGRRFVEQHHSFDMLVLEFERALREAVQ